MTRKRFIKLLMAQGYSRNEANTVAAYSRSNRTPYSTAYTAELDAHTAISKLTATNFDALCNAIGNLADMISRFSEAVSKAAAAFVKTFQAGMEENNP